MLVTMEVESKDKTFIQKLIKDTRTARFNYSYSYSDLFKFQVVFDKPEDYFYFNRMYNLYKNNGIQEINKPMSEFQKWINHIKLWFK